MNIFAPMKNLLSEAFSFKRYKGLPVPLAVILGIVLLPLWACAMVFVGTYYVAGAVVTLLNYPVDKLLGFVRDEAKLVHPATQVVVYLFGWPLVLTFKLGVIIWTIINYLLYIIATCILYLATLAGVSFDLKLTKTERDLTPEAKNSAAIFKAIIVLVFVGASLIYAILTIVFFILIFVGVPFVVALILGGITLGLNLCAYVWIIIAWGTHLFDFMNVKKEKKVKEKKASKAKELKKEEVKPEIKEEPEIKVEETPVEEEREEVIIPVDVPSEETTDEQPKEEERHFDFSSLDEYSKNRHPSDDYQAERLDDLDDDYDRR